MFWRRNRKARRAVRSRNAISRNLLALDAALDSALYNLGFTLADRWERAIIFFRRFRFTGWRRGVFEILGEGMTLGAVGSVALLALAMPAFEDTKGNWRAQDDFAVTFLDRYGNEIGQRGLLQRDSVTVEDMPDHVIQAVLATEDRRFFEHFGIDFLGLFRALSENVRAQGVVQGGSTLTQQLAKNLFLSNERTIERKIREAFLALWLESNLSKREILQLYLDRAYMGGGTFGINAAANFYFGKDIRDVTLAEAAMLAGLFKAPTKYAPHLDLPAARARANVVLSNMVEAGFMSEGLVLPARLNPAATIDRAKIKSPDYFLDWAFEEVRRIARNSPVHSLVAQTTIDMNIQQAAEESLEFHLRKFGKDMHASQGAIVTLESDGAVRAMVGGRDYGESQFNRATRASRQPGSSFKPYIYALAMERGMTPQTLVSDGPISWGNWSPKNYGRSFSGRMTLETALLRSINTVPVRLVKEKLTTAPVVALAHAMGVESELSTHKTMVLGTSGMTVLDQATGYNVFANGGYSGTRHAIMRLTSHHGQVIYDRGRANHVPTQVLSEQAVASMNSIMVQNPERGTGRRGALPGIRSASKTGTTQAYRDAWYVGYTGNYTTAVWIGNDDFSPTKDMTGGTVPAMVWQRVMAYAHQGVELRPIPGVENPFLSPEAVAKAHAEQQKLAEANAETSRPAAMPSRLTVEMNGALTDLQIRLLAAPQPIAANAKTIKGPERLSAVAEETMRR
ncbi:transglycosylase domain-containing protein [Limoniibacter endophyticus]|uniref:Penicillin-binding protein n=1 Tax=Limoniibacter endophyticus TaxID=1565040 RepID=A0A8J3DI75_9HYPH|nr:PBP1A family penicillin-binding protein [Limoniibacter endophyticus]GHC69402.1 penicillin-binding protein [Limoniibacter endophyticus]